MINTKDNLLIVLNFIRVIPHLIVYHFHKNRRVIRADVKMGLSGMHQSFSMPFGLIYLLIFCKQYRNIFYYRTRPYSFLFKILLPPLSNLIIMTPKIGEGFTIVHGLASAIGADSIGKNCKIYQQVTIEAECTILDNVTIYAGAIIFGNVTIGNNVVIGANSTVFTNVPDNSTVMPGSSKVMKWKRKADEDEDNGQ